MTNTAIIGPQGVQGILFNRPEIKLPPLREELRLLPASPNPDGTPAWMIQDPVNNRFFRIGWIDFEILLRWTSGTPKPIIEGVNSETTMRIDDNDVIGLLGFLDQHSLLRPEGREGVRKLARQAAAKKKGFFEWLLHRYLFFRIPLVRPQVWLAKGLPFFNWVFSPVTAWAVVGLTVLGLFLAARQWDTFASTFVDHLTWSGVLGYTVALMCAKALHELGHAFTATRYGVRVAHMGVALLVLFPMLYTDTSESWKLSNSRQRLAIASAGIITELALAGLATLAWSLAPEGPVRGGLFFLATTSWILTLAVNVSPFMRFDGYFILTDILDLPNLHERAGNLAKTAMRRILLGFRDAWPERLPGRQNMWLIAFAWITWVYRFTVFMGIAVLVYHLAFKLLGIFLMAVELIWFIFMPVWKELKVWKTRSKDIKANRKRYALIALGAFLLLVMIPWQSSIHAPGWLHAERQSVVHSPLAGRLVKIPAAGKVTAGQPLFTLESPDLKISADRSDAVAEARAKEMIGLAGLSDGEERRASLQAQQQKLMAEAQMYRDEQARLQLTVPFTGVLDDLDPLLAPGVWVQPRQPLAVVIDPSSWVVESWVGESDVARIKVGDTVRVHAGVRSLRVIEGKIIEVDTTRTSTLPHEMLDAQFGGAIATLQPTADRNRHNVRTPRDAIYRVKVLLTDAPPMAQTMPVHTVISGERRAWLPSALERVASVLVRESGF